MTDHTVAKTGDSAKHTTALSRKQGSQTAASNVKKPDVKTHAPSASTHVPSASTHAPSASMHVPAPKPAIKPSVPFKGRGK
jgi:hypothetical protein